MTDAVKGVSAQSVRYEDGQYRRSRLDRVKARALKNNKNSQNVFAKDKAAEYKRDIPELTQKQANSFGKKTMQNERAAANVDDTMVFIDQNKMNAAKNASKDSNIRYVYAEDENVRKIVAENPEDFYVNGEFSSDQYKKRFGGYTGFDNKGNLDEIATAASDYGVSKGTIRKGMEYAGYEREKDLTWLYKTLAALGVLGASAATGAIVGAKFTSNVIGIHNNGSEELLDTIVSSNRTGVGALRGLLAGVIPAIAAAIAVKDNGGKDIFNGNTAEEIVAKGEKNIETRIRGEANQKMMKAILRMPNISNEDKAIILKLAYGELTGKKVNDRELAAAYEIAKYCNDHPEINAKDFDKLPGAKPEENTVENNNNDDNNNNNNVVVNNNNNGDENNNTVVNQEPQKCELTVDGDDGVAKHDYFVRAGVKVKGKDGKIKTQGDNPYNIVQGKYKRADGKPMNHKDIMALRNQIFGKNNGLRKGKIELLDKVNVNGVDYVYKDGNVVLSDVDTSKPPKKMNFYKPVSYPGANYGVYNCDNEVLATGLPSRDAAGKEAARIAKENPTKYIFLGN